ncbi:hypothetical protein [uncultured Cellulomonas sp.]|uniref:hypothetical protein n=1 Tax=uncultured Cellulomonas sp. TaxID=189682 RepID=UPI00262682E5|nr:hypothetical protein [uncultured Cellulomonas sp.]
MTLTRRTLAAAAAAAVVLTALLAPAGCTGLAGSRGGTRPVERTEIAARSQPAGTAPELVSVRQIDDLDLATQSGGGGAEAVVHTSRRGPVRVAAWSALVVLAGAGCADGQNICVTNGGPAGVTVRLGEGPADEVGPDGGMTLLGATGCYGPVVVAFLGGSVVELEGTICPGEDLRIGDGTAEIVGATG